MFSEQKSKNQEEITYVITVVHQDIARKIAEMNLYIKVKVEEILEKEVHYHTLDKREVHIENHEIITIKDETSKNNKVIVFTQQLQHLKRMVK